MQVTTFSVVMMSTAEPSGHLKRYSRRIISFLIKGGLKASKNFLEKVKIFSLAESLGGVESLIEHPAIMTHTSHPKEVKEKLGISDELIRISVGIKNVDDLEKGFRVRFNLLFPNYSNIPVSYA